MTPPDLAIALADAARVPRLLVASDYDGCLSPIVPDPAAAIPLPAALEAFTDVARHDRVHALIVSGRSPEILERFVGRNRGITLIGNHGSELAGNTTRVEAVEEITRDLSGVARAHPGAVVEPKTLGAAFHYRHVVDEGSALADARAVGAQHGARTITGKKVLEFVFGEGDKGTAVAGVAQRESIDRTVFFGDDVTDEAVFEVLGEDDVGVKVGDGSTAARYRVEDPEGVAAALRHLATALQT